MKFWILLSAYFVCYTRGQVTTTKTEGEINWEPHYTRPYFENSTRRDVTVTVGQTAYLHCKVRNLGDRAVRVILSFIFFSKGVHNM